MEQIITLRNEKIYIEQLDDLIVKNHCEEILGLVNIIPHISWDTAELMSQDEDYYNNKWNYSYVIVNEKKEIIGIIVAYFRVADEKHIFDSLYLHRLAIAPKYQNQGIGTQAINYFINKAYEQIPWLLNISAQTNDTADNQKVINFYKNIGFKEMYNIYYPDKKDILMLFEKHQKESLIKRNKRYHSLNLKHPRLSLCIEGEKNNNVLRDCSLYI